jgi:hypothetical protein
VCLTQIRDSRRFRATTSREWAVDITAAGAATAWNESHPRKILAVLVLGWLQSAHLFLITV